MILDIDVTVGTPADDLLPNGPLLVPGPDSSGVSDGAPTVQSETMAASDNPAAGPSTKILETPDGPSGAGIQEGAQHTQGQD